MQTAWKINRNVTKYISFLIFLGFTLLFLPFLLITHPQESPLVSVPFWICLLVLSLFYRFCHTIEDKVLVFILLLPWISVLVMSIGWGPEPPRPPRPPQFEENLNKGLKYYKGLGVQQDHKEAMKWFKLALVEEEYSRKSPAGGITSSESAFMGDGGCFMSATNAEIEKRGRLGGRGLVQISENALGEIYEQGKDVQQNYEEAVKWYRRALSKAWSWSYQWQDCWKIMKYPKAHYNLGRMYDEGLGLPEDNHKAFLLLHAANYAWTTLSLSMSEGFANTWQDDYGQYFNYLDIADHHSMEDAKHRMDLIAKELESYPGEMNANVELYLTDSSYFQRMLAEDKK